MEGRRLYQIAVTASMLDESLHCKTVELPSGAYRSVLVSSRGGRIQSQVLFETAVGYSSKASGM
jgi:hypothetical protein